jgi:hypothetical protein
MIRIPIPSDLPLKEYLRLRTYADWYLRQPARGGPVVTTGQTVARRSGRLVPAAVLAN